MSAEQDNDNLRRLNAFVDGEVGPAERAEIAALIASDRRLAHSHAVLARLKACVSEDVSVPAQDNAAVPARRRFPKRSALAVAALLLVAGGYFGSTALRQPQRTVDRDAIERLIVQAALPAAPVVPDLAAGGMELSGIEVRSETTAPALVAVYAGPRGCRLELRIRHGHASVAGRDGTSRHSWDAGGLSYELVAFGMPEIRFAIIAGAAERQSRLAADPAGGKRLREARGAAPPCLS